MRIKISVTKEIYRKAMYCGYTAQTIGSLSENCAIALAIRDIAPKARVSISMVTWDLLENLRSILPLEVSEMISLFDTTIPSHRLNLPEFHFFVDFPDELVNEIGLSEVKEILSKSETLEMA